MAIGPKCNFIYDNKQTKAILFFFGCSEVNSTWLTTAELVNQRARKVLFTCVVYIYYTIASIWRKNSLGYLPLDIVSSENRRAVFRERVSYEEQIMSKDKFPSIFSV